MEILLGVLTVGLIIALSRLWSTACEESPSQVSASAGPAACLSANDTRNRWLLYDTVPTGDVSAKVDPPASGSNPST